MAQVSEKLIAEMVAAVVSEVNPEAVLLFGSYATGNQHSDSDVDLMIIKTDAFTETHTRYQEMIKIWRALAHFHVAKDILVYTHDEVEQQRKSRNHIIAQAIREGKLLYGCL